MLSEVFGIVAVNNAQSVGVNSEEILLAVPVGCVRSVDRQPRKLECNRLFASAVRPIGNLHSFVRHSSSPVGVDNLRMNEGRGGVEPSRLAVERRALERGLVL